VIFRGVHTPPVRPAGALRQALIGAACGLLCLTLTAVTQGAAQSPRPASRAPVPIARGAVLVDTLWSQALGTRKQYVVYLPPSYARQPARRYPVVYYLHGLRGEEWDWVRQGHLDATMDSLVARGRPELIVVMPDGDDGWYTTWNVLGDYRACQRKPPRDAPAQSYCVPWPHYDDYVARDLVAYVDSTWRTFPDRRHRAIAGLSMGGYGAVSLALAYPEVWSAAASHSGVLAPLYVGPHPFAGRARWAATVDEIRATRPASNWALIAPAFGRDTAGWWARDPARRAKRLLATRPALMPALRFDVGRDDAFADQNRAFAAELRRLGVPHTFRLWPGKHDWDYWRAHLGESLVWVGKRIGR
jgi:putative tributyrin esterase